MTITHLSPHNQRVLDLLQKADKPLSAYEILDKLRRYGFRSPPTVYRALEWLTKHGLIHRIESLNAFVACHQHAEEGHVSPFAICTSCGAVDELEDDGLMKAIQKSGQKFLKQVDRKVLEISGTCRACSAKQEAKV